MAILWLLLACSDSPHDRDDDPPPEEGAPVTLEGSCAPSDLVPTVLNCAWTSSEAGSGHVAFWPVDAPDQVRTTPVGAEGTTHASTLLGLKAGGSYGWRFVLETADGVVEGEPQDVVLADVPGYFPELTVEASDPARSEIVGGYVLTAIVLGDAPTRRTAIVIVDADGDYVWWVESADRGLAISPRFSRDGTSVRFLTSDILWLEDLGTISRVRLDGTERVDGRALLGHHAIWEEPDGSMAWLGFEYRTIDDHEWASDVIRIAPEDVDDTVEPDVGFSWFDSYGVDPWAADPGDDQVSLGDATEWTHTNSLFAIDDSAWYVMSKKLDCLLKIDRATGAIEWQMGGMYGDFTNVDGTPVWRGLSDQDLWSHAHMSHLWDGGLVVFDNGFFNGDVSRAVEYAYDEDARTVEEVWRYEEPQGKFTGTMGDVRKLDATYLIGWSSLGYVSEVTPEGDVVWQIRVSNQDIFGRVIPVADLYAPPDAGQP